jgi:hypothetical protein
VSDPSVPLARPRARVEPPYASADDLAAALRISVTPKTSAMLEAAVDAASDEIDHWAGRNLDTPIPADDALAHVVCIARGVEHYKANDVAFGALGFDNTGVLAAPGDSFDRHARTLIPLVQSFGIA